MIKTNSSLLSNPCMPNLPMVLYDYVVRLDNLLKLNLIINV
jgi:hypothetical protein